MSLMMSLMDIISWFMNLFLSLFHRDEDGAISVLFSPLCLHLCGVTTQPRWPQCVQPLGKVSVCCTWTGQAAGWSTTLLFDPQSKSKCGSGWLLVFCSSWGPWCLMGISHDNAVWRHFYCKLDCSATHPLMLYPIKELNGFWSQSQLTSAEGLI